MAIKTIPSYTETYDDLVGMLLTEDNAHTAVSFVFDGKEGTLDLSPAGYDALMALTGDDPDASGLALLFNPRRGEKRAVTENQDVRTWARAHGFDVKDSGRIPQPAQDAYDNAHRVVEDDVTEEKSSGKK